MSRLVVLLPALLLCLAFTLLLGFAVAEIAAEQLSTDLAGMLSVNVPISGVEHPVTAVLLNFRSYDTLLEIAVLVVAGMAGISLATPDSLEEPGLRTSDSLLYALQRWFVPLMLMLAAFLLWAGSDRPGGAFQAGSLLAAAGVLMRMGGMPLGFLRPGLLLRLGLVLGFAVFLLVAVASAVAGDAFLAYPQALAGQLIFLIESGLTFSIAMVLLSLFVAAPADPAIRAHREHKP